MERLLGFVPVSQTQRELCASACARSWSCCPGQDPSRRGRGSDDKPVTVWQTSGAATASEPAEAVNTCGWRRAMQMRAPAARKLPTAGWEKWTKWMQNRCLGGSRVCHFSLWRGSLFKQMGSDSCSTPVRRFHTPKVTRQSARKPHDLATAISLPGPNDMKLAKVKELAHVAPLLTCGGARVHVSQQLGSFIISRNYRAGPVNAPVLFTVTRSRLEMLLSASLSQLPAYTFLISTCSTVAQGGGEDSKRAIRTFLATQLKHF